MMQITSFVFNGMRSNTHLLWQKGGDCVIIDAGCNNEVERDEVTHFISLNHLTPKALLLTHGHFDHIMGAQWLCKLYGIEALLHSDDFCELKESSVVAGIYGVLYSASDGFHPHPISDEERLQFGSIRLSVLHTPGHTRGSVCYYEPSAHILFSGDTIIKGSLGFSNAGYSDLLEYLRERVLTLPADTRIFPGHGPSTTIEEEDSRNPFFKIMRRVKR